MTNNVTDGQWHHIDLFWNTKNARLVVDYCQSAVVAEAEDGTTFFNGTACQTEAKLPPFSEHLNLNTPLQIGGIYKHSVHSSHHKWQGRGNPEGFDGCIRNIFHNGEQLLDLSGSRMSSGTGAGCVKIENICRNLDCGNRGSCVADLTGSLPICLCQPGWSGITCVKPTHPFTFLPHSYVKFALSFEPSHFSTLVQMRFRTKETSGELIHIADHHSQEYAILEIRNSVLVFRYNLNSYYSEEIAICLCFIPVNDGYWHTVKASRYGSTAFLQIDDGENAQYNGTFSFRGHQLLVADKREGIYAGGKAEYTGMKTFEIQADFKNGCMDDIRLYGKSLPLPPVINATQWAQAVVAHNVVYGCTLNDSCAFVNCPEPLRCVEMSDSYECVCAEEVLKFGNSDCTDNNGCSQLPCWNGGMCISQDILLQYNCSCPDGTLGPNCESVLESQIFQLSPSALAAIITCFICIFDENKHSQDDT
ncbi:putative neural-cadherin 2 [Schistocerca nitens]|uniref:putative neural-cadherin 2 n=1 Tax=Schistocerca nitens TaxID=7011 RepID=UPI0021196BCB|nr:putative neural-cadherin 2 [Schistocerca nitens]